MWKLKKCKKKKKKMLQYSGSILNKMKRKWEFSKCMMTESYLQKERRIEEEPD